MASRGQQIDPVPWMNDICQGWCQWHTPEVTVETNAMVCVAVILCDAFYIEVNVIPTCSTYP